MVYKVEFRYSLKTAGTNILQSRERDFAILTNNNGLLSKDSITWYVPPRIEIELTRRQYESITPGTLNIELAIGRSAKPVYSSTDTSLEIGLTATPAYYWMENLTNILNASSFDYFMFFDFQKTKYISMVLMDSPELPHKLPRAIEYDLDIFENIMYAKISETQFEKWENENLRAVLKIILGS